MSFSSERSSQQLIELWFYDDSDSRWFDFQFDLFDHDINLHRGNGMEVALADRCLMICEWQLIQKFKI
ncbi:hypothetical protein C7271_12055 [filamentous cyanobacterium CCP5]|nr:hypothetical protein C7271_12055 [filamentous cyanobacterium CCP5]